MALKKDPSSVRTHENNNIIAVAPVAPQYVAGKTLGEKYSLTEYITQGTQYLLSFKENISKNINPDFLEECYQREKDLYISGQLIL